MSDSSDRPANNPRKAINKDRDQHRLPPELKAWVLAELPPPEERERMYQELSEKGGLSAKEFLASLGLDVERKP
jgi:hypothetical protein